MFKSFKDVLSKNIIFIIASLIISSLGFLGYKITMSSIETIKQSQFSLSSVALTDQKNIDTISTKAELEDLIKQYIISNPEIIFQALEGVQESSSKDPNEKISLKIQEKKQQIFDVENSPYLGKKNAPIKIVAFLDYNCGYCKKANDALNQIIANDPNVCVIYKLNLILGDPSEYLSKVALAVHKIAPDKFKSIHDKLMHERIENKDALIKVLAQSQINFDDLNNQINTQYIQESLQKSVVLAKYIGVTAVPAMIINDKFYSGFIDAHRLKAIIEETQLHSVKLENISE